MQGPLFTIDDLTHVIENPSGWQVKPIIGRSESLSLDGSTLNDFSYRKFEYELKWDAISKEEYEKLEELYVFHLDESKDVFFQWDKLPRTEVGVTCKMKLSARGFVAGSGNELFYSQVTLLLTEVEGV